MDLLAPILLPNIFGNYKADNSTFRKSCLRLSPIIAIIASY
jgi:hypothetical protein